MRDVSLIHKELAEMTGMKTKLGQPPEDPRLEDLLNQIAEHEARLAELLSQIAELEAKIDMTEEEEAILARLDTLIENERVNIVSLQTKINELEKQVSLWRARWDTAREFAKRLDPNAIIWPKWPVYHNISGAGLGYLNAWGDDAVEGLADYRKYLERFAREPIGEKEVREEIIYMEEERFSEIIEDTRKNPDLVGGLNIFMLAQRLGVIWPSKHNFRIHNWDSTFRALMEDLVARAEGGLYDYDRSRWGIKYIAWAMPGVADSWRPEVAGQIELAERTYHDLYTQLRDAKDELERANRRLWDAKAAKERAELEIRRAIALREAEVYAAKQRYELELRTLDNLKATYETLLKEIDLAKAQAIAEATRQREEVIKAKEKDRLAIAEEQRRIAEEAERMAAETAGTEREEWLDKMRIALELAKDAEEAAITAAEEREAIATEIATRKAELALLELELEELRKQQQIAEERKKETEAEVAGLPAIPKWGWIALGIGGATATAGGIAYAIKKRKKK